MARFNEWCPALEAALEEPFPAAFVQQKRKGSSSIDFVAWHHYARRLNDLVGGGWGVGELSMREVGGKLLISLPLTILGTTRVNVGTEDEDKDDYGDAATNAWAQAFKRSAALFGLGLGMYDKGGSAERHRHSVAVEAIRKWGAVCEEEAVFRVEGKQHYAKAYIRENWPAIKEQYRVARAVVDAIEESTGERLT